MDSRNFAFYFLSTWIFLNCLFYTSFAELKTYYLEDYCNKWKSENSFYLQNKHSGILASYALSSGECTIRLIPEPGFSVVLSLYRFRFTSEDQLTITDADKFKVALVGEGDFPDERKSFTSNGPMSIYFSWNNTEQQGSRLKFQFVFTQVYNGVCRFDEFECRNKKCLSYDLVCSPHNHCGDNSHKEKCGPKIDPPKTRVINERVVVKRNNNAWLITIIICSVILFIIIIIFIVMIARSSIRRKKKLASRASPSAVVSNIPPSTVEATIPPTPSAPPATEAPPTLFARFRQSLRGIKPSAPTPPEEPKTDKYQVPSMYPQIHSSPNFEGVDNPQIHSSPNFEGVDNPEFKGDEA